MNIEDAKDRVESLTREHANYLRAEGYVNIIEKRPHIAINQVLRRLKPVQLYLIMLDIMTWRRKKHFHKENINQSVKEVAVQADKKQTERRIAHLTYKKLVKGGNHQTRTSMYYLKKSTRREVVAPGVSKSNGTIYSRLKIRRRAK